MINITTYVQNSNVKGNFQCCYYMKPENTIENGNKSNGKRRQVLRCFPDCLIKISPLEFYGKNIANTQKVFQLLPHLEKKTYLECHLLNEWQGCLVNQEKVNSSLFIWKHHNLQKIHKNIVGKVRVYATRTTNKCS